MWGSSICAWKLYIHYFEGINVTVLEIIHQFMILWKILGVLKVYLVVLGKSVHE